MHHNNAEYEAGAYSSRLGYVGEQSPEILNSCIIASGTHLAMRPQWKDNSTHHPAAHSSPQPPPSTDTLIDLLFSNQSPTSHVPLQRLQLNGVLYVLGFAFLGCCAR